MNLNILQLEGLILISINDHLLCQTKCWTRLLCELIFLQKQELKQIIGRTELQNSYRQIKALV